LKKSNSSNRVAVAVQLEGRCNVAKRKRRALARKKTAARRGKVRARVKSTRRKVAKRAGRKTKAKKQTTKPRAKSAATKKATPRPPEPPRQPAEATEEVVIVDIIEEPAPGVVVVTEFESVQTTTPLSEGGEGSGPAGGKEEEH
jgi:hypothetical protein